MSYQFFKRDEQGNITHVRAWMAYLILAAAYLIYLGVAAGIILLFVQSVTRILG